MLMEALERLLDERGPNADLLVRYADALAKLGRVRESLLALGRLAGTIPAGATALSPDRLRGVAGDLLEQVCAVLAPTASDCRLGASKESMSLTCPACDCILQSPVTLPCGHTICNRCLGGRDGRICCPRCSYRLLPGASLVTNVLVQRLVERWWPQQIRAASLRDQGNALFHAGQVLEALRKYDEAVQLAPASSLLRSNRSHALCCLGRHQAALQDADEVVRLRPTWGKGHYRRGVALSALCRYEEALVAFCLCSALERNPHAVRGEVARVLHRLLTGRVVPRGSWRPLRYVGPCSSDCEDNSSADEDADGASTPRPRVREQAGYPARLHLLLDRLMQDMDKLKRAPPESRELAVDSLMVDHSELDCVLCCRTLWKPVTTPCGHTYCCSCLDRCLDYRYSCPLCMTSLSDYLATSPRNVTEWVERALWQAAPRELALRQATHAQDLSPAPAPHAPQTPNADAVASVGPSMPVFVCTTAFPGVPCPLYVYEPRYRLMVRRCMEAGTRTFGMAACVYRNGGIDRYAEFGTLLEICDHVRLSDGSSILTTIGSQRFRVLQRAERDGYDVANMQLFSDDPLPIDRIAEVRALHNRVRSKSETWLASMDGELYTEIRRSFGNMPDVEEGWERTVDGPAWSWYLLAVLPLSPQLQLSILSTTSLEKRLRAIDKTLDLAERQRSAPSEVACSGSTASCSASPSTPGPLVPALRSIPIASTPL